MKDRDKRGYWDPAWPVPSGYFLSTYPYPHLEQRWWEKRAWRGVDVQAYLRRIGKELNRRTAA